MSDEKSRPGRVEDAHGLALAMPHVTVSYRTGDNPIYQVGRKSFIFFRSPRPDAVDPETGQRYQNVIVFWVGSEADKQSLITRGRRSSARRTSTAISRCCCGPAVSVS